MKIYVVKFGKSFYKEHQRLLGCDSLVVVDRLKTAKWFESNELANQISQKFGGLIREYEIMPIESMEEAE